MSFVVVTRVRFKPAAEQEVLSLAKASMPIAARQPGLESMQFHRSHAGNETMMYWLWDERASHEACMASQDWGILSDRWDRLLGSGNAEFFLDTYEPQDP
jgi:heme-degrading monooxygenase HmoA